MEEITKVVFRKYPDGDCIALFPEIQAVVHNPYLIESYMRVGQHSSADYGGVIKDTSPATEEDYKDLYQELLWLGYKLKICKKFKFKPFWRA